MALGKSISLSCVCKTGVATFAHRCCWHYLINEQRVGSIKCYTNADHDECNALQIQKYCGYAHNNYNYC